MSTKHYQDFLNCLTMLCSLGVSALGRMQNPQGVAIIGNLNRRASVSR